MHVDVHHSYNGKVVAKLPFQPFSYLAKVTRRGIEDTEDISLCAWVRVHIKFGLHHSSVRQAVLTPILVAWQQS